MSKEKKQTEKWENIVRTILRNKGDVRALLTDEIMRSRMQFFCIFFIFSIVSAAMTIVNVFTSWHLLMLSTLVFAVANVINMALMLVDQQMEKLSRMLFAVETLALFSFFLIFGEPEGFSAIWIALLPACGLLLYKLKYGIIFSLIQLVIVIFLFRTKAGNSLLMFEYTGSFMRRFPLLYMAFFFVGIFFEYIRYTTQKELTEMRYRFEHLSKHDPLTGLFNRLGFYADIENRIAAGTDEGCALAIIDLDNFKTVNDRFGHLNGDTVLKKISDVITAIVGDNGSTCRWGGDELSVFFNGAEISEKLCAEILSAVRETEFEFLHGEHVTVSIGLTLVRPETRFELADLIAVADKNLYSSKNSGKDMLRISEYIPAAPETDTDITVAAK